jgi:hypothetical protein
MIELVHTLIHHTIESLLGTMAIEHSNAKRVEHGLLLERSRPLAQVLLLLLSLVSSLMICKIAVFFSK